MPEIPPGIPPESPRNQEGPPQATDEPGEDLPLPPPRPPRKVGIIDLEPSQRLDASSALPKGFAVTPGKADLDHGSDAPGRPAWSSVFSAAFRQDQTVSAYFADETRNAPDYVDPAVNTWDHIKGYEDHWESFINDRNIPRIEARKRKIDREREDRKLLEAAPWWQSLPAQMAAGVFDLPTLMPGGAFVRGVRGGFSIARSAMSVGAAATASSAVQEGVLQGITETRTAGESAINIGASTLLGGLLGAGGAKLMSAVEWRRAVKAMERETAGLRPMPDAEDLPEFEGADLS
ncbi:MAG TPA: hypothetical protein VEI97_06115, partial [bacterium]|nr:hypothetical protein [bacterium]